ncbi:MAG TPA: DUF3784 domain-containing protein [Bacteroidales bacterium]|nr:MAG: hypothetical protein BWX93_01698 [Bacteroidetes bacterium ADurb.Bin139]HOG25969.1 DUF3784 domain-containing protein [Bacteroidales bacterium]HOR10934.1 DUF3784 domain-containing protein [Bacteroidales bacterium]HOZ19968.1 DUF3784 domain-containing protein [Bacteroidales bacterium]HPB78527.1 DUF3784 domain-containing protein [Bacteroidales bacterium]
MGLIHLFIGLFFIILGFLVRSFPGIIAGYNTMPAEKKKNIDMDGLSRFLRNGLIIMGLAVIFGYLLFHWAGWTYMANMTLFIVAFTGGPVLMLASAKFDHNPGKKSKSHFIIFGIVVILITGLMFMGFMTTKTQFSNDTLRFTGIYATEMNIREIENVELADTIPSIRIKNNGFSLGAVHKGIFTLEEFGRCRLYINSGKGQYLIITDKKGFRTILRYKDNHESQAIHQKIEKMLWKTF